MIKRCATIRMVASRAKGRLPRVLFVFLLCGAFLASQAGCHKQADVAEAPVVAAEPARVAEAVPEPAVAAEAAATPEEAPEPPAAKNGPRITLESVICNFGDIGTDTKHKGQFKFKNTGNRPLKIVQVKSCCGVATTGVKAGDVYPPGKGGVLTIDYRAGAHPGDVNRKLYIQSNDPVRDVVTLTLKAKIVRRVEYEPKRLRLFLKQENGGADAIKLTSVDGRPFSIEGFKCTANSIKAEFDPNMQATEFVLRPQADLAKLERNLKGQISIDLSHPECKNVRLLYDVLPEFTINPPQILLFNLVEGKPVQREVWILSNYSDDFDILSVTSRKETVKLLEKKKIKGTATSSSSAGASRPGVRYQLRIEITPPPVEGERAVFLDFLDVKIKDGTTLSIQCRGFY
ncbi:MAG: DUF1573 domain-containing protein [Sedimentisphaerales bacterium]|nr:DUF1573 domain-containing protein [Sedimentisphaerales bacterium]